MSQVHEVTIVLGLPDYDVPLDAPAEHRDGLAVTGRDSLSYLWRFAGERASLWALDDNQVGRQLGNIGLGQIAPDRTDDRCVLLREAQVRRRRIQAAYVQLVETLFAMAGDAPRPELQKRLREIRVHLADELLLFTDPVDDHAHAEFRMVPEIVAMADTIPEEREKLRPLASSLLDENAALLGIEDPNSLIALTQA